MRNLSVLLVTAALGIFAVGCKPGPNITTFPTIGGANNQIQNPINNNSNVGGLAGTYHIDTEHFNMQLHGQTPPKDQLDQMVAQLKQSFASVSLNLNADGTYQSSGFGQNSNGHYTLNGNSIQFQSDQPGQSTPQLTVSPDGSKLLFHIETQAAGIDLTLIH